ncbi:Nonribosomal peptide synthetase 14 [Fusarium oxysporum f. sp. narcissi]|uniref:Nonribosomal peptide synthetase 14 n=1 Tax=Fusarium oxysporum f. sp. narcissi TaxID=451672 RepID=A0A4Q2VXV3_FUSOX|nr:Nonribosomal peptide synthetase 14 [Fusarium oxysporum f. sp. narcissi]
MSDNEPIAVIGSACRFPGDTSSPSKLWDLLKSPRDLLTKVPSNRYNADAFYHADSKHHGTTNVRHSYFLNEDPARFDNNFFNIQPGEAEAIDPQQRLLMEVVYQGLCASGQTIEGLRGSPTAVYVGVMCDDWSGIITRDLEVFPQYGATGMARSIMSNRISYFFDWHGPSMTIDTACSSSLVAVHQAIQTLRSGESEVAIAAGANLILTPGMYVAESKLSMLSPSGRSKMWDQDVNGYARGEGIAAVVLKPLSAAIRDNDHIDCIIRATGVNQDGRTPGLTMPSATAQADLIRSTYARAGLDINKPEDRPQFFHAHGTGTPAGDPREAEAIYRAFYSDVKDDKLYVGSIKTVLGHTEGTAGLASLIGTALAIQNKTIPPNMHFDVLNPKIKPFYDNLEVPTKAIAWPETKKGQPRRASINSFGFGGTNAHAIIEAYEPGTTDSAPGPLFSPLTFSASSESSLRSLLSSYSGYLKSNPELSLEDLAYTLQTRRSTLAYRVAITASDVEDVYTQLDAIENGEQSSTIGVRQVTKASPKIMGVFTGQGAQWPRMGARLLEESAFASKRFSELDEALSSLPKDDRPSWALREMIIADAKSSRIAEAAISQPLCTAVQVVLVDLLRQAGVELSGVVGHSSGEIGAAYAAGLLTARDAIRVAYYRGLYAKLAQSPNGCKGAMMAVGTTFDDASEFCELDAFQGRIQVAARNSSSSITLSGDEDAIVEAIETFKDEGKFARQLKVDTAYHSSHVLPCAKPYLEAMESCQIESATPTATKWYSSVHDGQVMTAELLTPQYWVDNMTSAVLFSPAVEHAWQEGGPYDLIIEVGPHPVLKTPCLDTLEDMIGDRPPYSGVLGRGKDDIQQFSNGLGFIWTQLGAGSVTFERFEKVASDSKTVPSFIHDLPNYPFDHARQFMSMSRVSGWYNSMQEAPHPILGRRCHDRETSQTIQWRNVLNPKEIPWLHGHQIQGQIIFPATGYISMAVEAVNIIAESNLGLVTIEDLRIGRALAFSDDDASVESMFDLRIISRSEKEIEAEFSCYSGLPQNHTTSMVLNATAHVKASLSVPTAHELPNIKVNDFNLREVEVDRFYDFLGRLGYNYSWPFHGTTSIRRKANFATGTLEDQSGSEWEDQLLVHPGMLDTSLQTTFAAFCCPGDERMWALHLPTSFRSIVINPYFTSAGIGKQKSFQYQSVAIEERKASKVIVELNLLSEETGDTFLQIEGMELVPFSPATPENDAVLFSRFDYRLASPDGELTAAEYSFRDEDYKMALDSERIAFYYLRRLVETITPEEKANTLPHYRHLVDWAAHVVPQVIDGRNPHIPSSAQKDTHEDIQNILKKHYERVDVRLLESVGENLPQVIRESGNILEHMTKDGMLDDVYEEGFGLDLVNKYIAHMTAQIAHRYPRMNILEIGAGTGGSTREILPRLGSAFSTYTYTDVSGGFFDTAQDRFQDFADRMIFKTFDMNISPGSQGFTEGTYDLVIASNVLHATLELEDMMKHVRSFLKPGGFLIILETVNNDCLRVGLPMGSLPGWWLGAEHGRRWGPTLTLPQWDSLLWKCGFGGIDTTTPPVHKILPGHVFCAQALDERVEILRSPLSHLSDLPETKSTELAIVGGETLKVHRMCEQISRRLKPKYASIARFNSIEELNTSGLADSCTVVSLTELDEPLFANMTSGKLDALKTLWKQGGSILWVTSGARDENPHSYMTTGVGRCMRFEYPNITLQALDIKTMTDRTPELIADHLLRLELLDKWSKELRSEELLWSLEPEIYIDDDTSIVPRLYPYESGNARYNAERRNVVKDANLETDRVIFAENEGKWEVQHASPLHIPRELPFAAKMKTIRITHFSPATVNVTPGVSLMACVGIDTVSSERLLAATHIAESPVSVPADWCIPLGELDAVDTLANVSAFLIASSILKHVATEETLVVHNAPSHLASALEGLAKESSVTVFLTTSDKANTKGWQYIDSHLPERVIKASIPKSATKFINLSQDVNAKETGRAISACLPRYCETINAERLFESGKVIRQSVSKEDVSIVFNRAFYEAKSLSSTAIDASLVSLKDISGVSAAEVRFAVVDSKNSSVKASIRPIDDGRIFQADRTFLLIGLSGELGQSLCKWMVEQGARNIVLTSRRPNVSQHFLDEMATMGATVKALPMDVTNRDSLHACVDTIQKTLPPIAGVVNGAMVLRDALFENMPYEDFMKVLSPKVLGSQLLDEMFYDTPLDFFIFFSSTTAVMGNSGQSNYIAGNMFMNALAAQRKKRGVAASSIDISSIIGLGYVERAEDLSEDTFIKMGYKPMSEQDLQKLFAEAIVLGRPECDEVCELVTGVTPIYTDAQASDQYLKDVKFGHFLMERLDTQAYTGKTSTVPVRVQLADVKTKADAVAIIKDSFIVRLRRVLAVGPDEIINEKVTLVEQGVDSLMAVEVRSWFIKELDVDIPVLKILGGMSVPDLVEESLDLISDSILDVSSLEAGSAPTTQSIKPVLQTARVTPPESSHGTSDESKQQTGSDSSRSPIDTPLTSMESQEPAKAEDSTDNSTPLKTFPNELSSIMSYGQAGFWFLNDYLINKKAFNMAVMLKLTGQIRVQALEKAVNLVAERHEILRTRFFWGDDGDERTPLQGINPADLKLTTKKVVDEGEAEMELKKLHDEEWDLSGGEGVKITLLSLSDNVHFLLLGMHHIYIDGYSFSVFFKDLEVAYTKHTLPSLPVESQYRSFALQQRQMYANGDLTKSIEYYRRSFPKEFTPVGLFPFALTPARQFANDYSQHEAKMSIDPELATKVRQLARVNRSTSFHVYLAALELLLFTLLPSAEEVFIGIADANRSDKKFMGSLGFFLNLLPLRFGRKRRGTQLSSIIQTARDTAYGALQHSQLPFDVLLRELNVPRSDKYTPIFQVFMDYRQVVQERSSWGGCKLHGEKWHNAGTGYDIALEVTENITTDTLLSMRLQKQLYSEEHTALLLRSYLSVLEYMVQGTNKAADAAPAWSKDDLQVALDAGKAPKFLPKWHPTISHHIDQIIQANATKVALKDGNGTVLTYEQMGKRIDSIAQALVYSGTTQGTVVGVFQEPSSNWICSLLAIFKAGAVYVPLDLRNSIPRLTSIVKASRPSLIITDHTTDDKVELIGAKFITKLQLSKLVDQEFKEPNRAKTGSLAVILFTSGSTGEPKGLMMTHTNLISYAEVSSKTFSKPDENLVVLQQSPFSFDFSLDQTMAALANGGCLCIVPASKRGDPDEISKIMVKEGVTYTTATPSEYDLWLRYSTSTLRQCISWKYAFSGGEAMSHKLAREFGTLNLANLHVFNGYGPAETTILSHRINLKYTDPELPDPLPAGYPMPGFSVCIVDEKMRPVPLGVQGEIVLGGPCIVSGYLNMPDSTKDKFLPDTFFGTSGKVYRSGDRGRLCHDGLLFCDGRLEGSNMIKLRGFRVELDEVEKTIISHSAGALSHAVVTLRGSEEGRYLAAHVVFAPEFPEYNRESIMKTLRQTLPLPPYMRPSAFQILADIPRTAHLKIDRKAIQEMPVQVSDSHDSGALTIAEQRLSELWRRVLPLDPGSLSPESDFFLIGGNSILLVKLQALLRQTFETAPKLVALMGASTLGAMAIVLENCGSVGVIDWDRETALPDDLRGAATLRPVRTTKDITVLLTGSAGYLGRHLLPALVNDSRVTRVHCLVRSVNNEKLSTSSSTKVRVIESDVSKPDLGLSASTYSRLAEETDVIIHSAANRSFWDRYEVLRPDNVDSVKELVRFAASSGRSIPLHFLSSGAVKTYDGDGLTPPTDGSDGYVATKWASETFLRNATGSIDLPVYTHRPTVSSTSQTKADQASIINELISIVKSLGVRPSFEGVTGSVDVLPIGDIVMAIQDSVLSSSAGGEGYNIVQHEAHQRAFVEDFASVVRADDTLNKLPSISILDWFGKAKKAGFSYFLASQDLVMGSGEGHLVSRR